MENLTPTKANLIKSQSMLTFTRQGYQLLDKKRNVLIREMMDMIEIVRLASELMKECSTKEVFKPKAREFDKPLNAA